MKNYAEQFIYCDLMEVLKIHHFAFFSRNVNVVEQDVCDNT